MAEGIAWLGPALNAAGIILLAVVLRQLGRDPAAAWREREARLGALLEELRGLAAEAERRARELDGTLAAHAGRLRALLERAGTAAVPGAPAGSGARSEEAIGAPESAAASWDAVHRLAASGTPVEEIAGRLGMPAAEVRLLAGLGAARAAARGSRGQKLPADSAA
jgi:hypothetical protein